MSIHRRRHRIAAVLFLWALPAMGQLVPSTEELQINTFTTSDQDLASIASDDAGNFVVVWSSDDQDGDALGIFGQRFDNDGNPLGSEFQVNTTTEGAQGGYVLGQDVAMDADGDFVVVWASGDEAYGIVLGQRFDATGAPVGGEFPIGLDPGFGPLSLGSDPNVAMDSDGNFAVSWTAGSAFLGGTAVASAAFAADGTPAGLPTPVSPIVEGGLFSGSDVALDDDGNIAVTWTEGLGFLAPAEESDVYAEYFSVVDGPAMDIIQVNTTTLGAQGLNLGAFGGPSVDLNDNGEFIVVWASNPQDAEGFATIAQRFDSNGMPVGGEMQLNTTEAGDQFFGDVLLANDGSFTATWSSAPGVEPGSVILQGFQADGTPKGLEFRVNENESESAISRLAENGAGVSVVWTNFNDADGDDNGVFARIFSSLVGHWPLDEGSGLTAASTLSNGLDGALEGGTDWTLGQQSNATSHDGVDSLIRVADSGVFSPLDLTGGLTIALWVRPDALDGTTQALVSKDEAYELEFGKIGAKTWNIRLDNVVEVAGDTPLVEGVWQHLAATWDGSTLQLYYNGLPDGSVAFTGPLTPNDNDLGFGGRPSEIANGGPVFHLDGALDEIWIFGNALSDVEIADLVLDELTDIFAPVRSNLAPAASVAAGSVTATLSLDTDEAANCRYDSVLGTAYADMSGTFTVTGGTSHSTDVPVVDGHINTFAVRCQDALGNTNNSDALIVFGVDNVDLCDGQVSTWFLDEGAGCTAADETGTNDGALGPACTSNSPVWVAGRDGSNSALAFDGGDDRVEVASPSGLSSIGEVTLAAWIQHGSSGIFRSIIDRRDSGTDGFDLFLTPSSTLFMRVNGFALAGNTVVADGQWHHVAGVYDGNEIRLFVDGVLDASAAVGSTTVDVNAPLYLGRHFGGTQFSFNGNLDEAAIYSRGLSDIEVLDLYLGASCNLP